MKIYVDIDETIAYILGKHGRDYKKALPVPENIAKINKLFDAGHEITYWTARGATTGIDWTEVTQRQLKAWGCKHHNLSVGDKPEFDMLIDDKAKRIEEV